MKGVEHFDDPRYKTVVFNTSERFRIRPWGTKGKVVVVYEECGGKIFITLMEPEAASMLAHRILDVVKEANE